MKAQPKAVFLLLAMFAASASANVRTGTIRGHRAPSAELEHSGELDEASSFDVVETVPDRIAGLKEDEEEDEDYDDEEEDEDYDDEEEDEEEVEDEPKKVEEANLDEEGLNQNSRTPSSRRNGQRFRFSREGGGACLDRNDNRYSWGSFNNVRNSDRCAEICVQRIRSNMLGELQGFEFISNNNRCRCLFNRNILGVLNTGNTSRFDNFNTSERGRGPVRGRSSSGSSRRRFKCFKLTDATFVGMNDAYESEFDEVNEMES